MIELLEDDGFRELEEILLELDDDGRTELGEVLMDEEAWLELTDDADWTELEEADAA